MTSRQLFFGVTLLLWGAICLLCNRLLAEEAGRWQDSLPELPLRFSTPPLLGRILIIAGGLASLILGSLLLARVIN